jgi:hypothetical protein
MTREEMIEAVDGAMGTLNSMAVSLLHGLKKHEDPAIAARAEAAWRALNTAWVHLYDLREHQKLIALAASTDAAEAEEQR